MSAKADERLAKLASFGAKAAVKQQQAVVADPSPALISAPAKIERSNGSESVLIRNVAFTEREQEILKMIMERLREAGELTPSFSMAVKVGLRLIPLDVSLQAVHLALDACKARDRRRRINPKRDRIPGLRE
jgi:hypothetical protein